MTILLLQLDGRFPNLALMRAAAHHRAAGDDVELRVAGNNLSIQPRLGDPDWTRVYASAIFERSLPLAEAVSSIWPAAVLGGSGIYPERTLAHVGISPDGPVDYRDYPTWRMSLGFSQRGCRLRCPFCVVPRAEGAVRPVNTIRGIWRGAPWPRQVVLLDNDFFGNPQWPARVREAVDGHFSICLTQGVNVRTITDDAAAALAEMDCRDNRFREKRVYTAFDNGRDERRFRAGIKRLIDAGVAPRSIFVYMLIGYWPGESHGDRDRRRAVVRELGAKPYPMPFRRTDELVAYQRWVIGGYDTGIPWPEWQQAGGRPERLTRQRPPRDLLDACRAQPTSTRTLTSASTGHPPRTDARPTATEPRRPPA